MEYNAVVLEADREEIKILTKENLHLDDYVIIEKNQDKWIGIVKNKRFTLGEIGKAFIDLKFERILKESEWIENRGKNLYVIQLLAQNDSEIIDIPTHNVLIRKAKEEEIEKAIPKGSIEIGKASNIKIYTNKNVIFSPHIGVFGQTGSGKSNFVKLILKQIKKEDPDATIIILDRHGEYEQAFGDYAKYPEIKIDIKNLNPNEYVSFYELLFNVPPNYTNLHTVLFNTLDLLYEADNSLFENRTIADFFETMWGNKNLEEFRELKQKLNRLSMNLVEDYDKTRIRLLRRWRAIERFAKDLLLLKPSIGNQYIIERIVPNQINIIRLKAKRLSTKIYGAVLSILLYETLLLKTGEIDLSNLEKSNIYIVMEEAHAYLNRTYEDLLETAITLAREGRKFNVHLLVVAQSPSGLDSELLSQLTTIAAFRLTAREDINRVADMLGISASSIKGLPKYTAYFYSVEFRLPMPLKIRSIKHDTIKLIKDYDLSHL